MKRLFLLVPTAALLITSCATERASTSGWNYNSNTIQQTQPKSSSPQHSLSEERKLIYNASVDMDPVNVDSVNLSLLDIAHRNGGYILKSGPEMSSIRVRSESLRQVLNEIARLGKVRNQKVWGNDVTEDFKDLEILLDNLKKTRARYLELLQKAGTIEETLKVEKELERLSAQIDQAEGKLLRLSHVTAYSTIDIHYRAPYVAPEKRKLRPGPLGYVFIGLYKGVKWLFVRG